MLDITFTTLHIIGLGYLQDCLFLRVSAHLVRSDRVNVLQVPSLIFVICWDLEGVPSL